MHIRDSVPPVCLTSFQSVTKLHYWWLNGQLSLYLQKLRFAFCPFLSFSTKLCRIRHFEVISEIHFSNFNSQHFSLHSLPALCSKPYQGFRLHKLQLSAFLTVLSGFCTFQEQSGPWKLSGILSVVGKTCIPMCLSDTHIICTETDPTLVVHDCGDVCEAWCEAQVRPAANSGDKWIFVDQTLGSYIQY